VGAGATLGAVQAHARASGLEYGVDLSSRDSATLGATIATNAGGMNVVANGDTRRQVVGLEVVFADGSVGSRLDGVAKESTGPDPLQLMVGSEGSLGIITSARLSLVPRPTEMMVTMVGVGSLAEGLACLPESGVHAAEFFDRRCLGAVIEHRGLSRPLKGDSPLFVLIESSEPPLLTDDADAVVDRKLWAYRESITETVNQIGVPVKLDVAVPLDRVDDLVAAVTGLDLTGDVYLWGHLVEGNFHVNVVGDPDPDRVVDRVLEVVIGLGGVIASEHGIGVAKAGWWRRTSDPAHLEMMRRIKDTLDPRHILNPEVFWGG
jgi:FAD/FMN-containing dehydrogenase